jgi:hypothetical protein
MKTIYSIQKGSGWRSLFGWRCRDLVAIDGFLFLSDYDHENRFADNDMIHQSRTWMNTEYR